ncbi:MAG: DUF3168 domain-containing protein [Pseudomonadota bacterium]
MADHAFWALQKAVYQHLADDAGVLAVLGGTKIFDDVPRSATYPYVTLGAGQTVDWSTGDGEGAEHILTLNVWSRSGGRREILRIAEALRAALLETDLVLSDHRLVLLRMQGLDVRRGADGETYQGIMRFRVLTEVSV